jgi:translocation and assembly module TamA
VASDVVAAGDRVRQTLQDDGFAYATVDPPHAVENPAEHTLDVSFKVTPGERHELGEIRLQGLNATRESFVRRRLRVHAGDLYRASAIEAARKDLLAAGVFTQVSVTADAKPDAQGHVPLTFQLRERKPHAAGVTAAYSSDLGASVGVNWLKREISGVADPFSVSASIINLGGGTASNGIGYDLHSSYQIPDWKRRDQTLQFDAGALRQSLDAYDQTALKTGVSVRRRLSRLWTVSAGITAEHEQIVQESPPDPVVSVDVGCTRNIARPRPGTSEPRCTYHYTLLGVPIAAIYNTTGLDSPLEDATKGVRASLTVTPTFALGHQRSQFVVTELSTSTYFDLAQWGLTSDRGRSVLAVRALAGLSGGADEFSLPPDQRFYAGGSGTIRGYRYQSVGPAFPDGNPVGGTAINAASVEFRQRIGEALGFAVFVDAGNVSDTLNPFHGSVRIGAGAGFRYYTPLGPLRVDLAVPLERRSGPGFKDDAFEVYIGLGQAF